MMTKHWEPIKNKKKIDGADVYFECVLEIPLDCGPLGGFIRGAMKNVNHSLPYAYQLDVRVNFNNNKISNDRLDVVSRDSTPWTKNIFQIEQPISRSGLEHQPISRPAG